jgi:hypothetical protein
MGGLRSRFRKARRAKMNAAVSFGLAGRAECDLLLMRSNGTAADGVKQSNQNVSPARKMDSGASAYALPVNFCESFRGLRRKLPRFLLQNLPR